MRKKLNRFTLIFILLISNQCISVLGQNKPAWRFKVISLPKIAGFDVLTLNSEISYAANKMDVIRIINSHKQLLTVPITIKIKKENGENLWWQLNPNHAEKEGDFTVLQSKAIEPRRFYKRKEVQQYFRDTIVVIDTLKLNMFLQDENFRIENYFLKMNGFAQHLSIPYDKNNNLLVTDSLFNNKLLVNATLYNVEDTSKAVANMNLYFANEQVKRALIDIAESLKDDMPEADYKEIANRMSGYINNNYGFVSYKDLVKFLKINLQ